MLFSTNQNQTKNSGDSRFPALYLTLVSEGCSNSDWFFVLFPLVVIGQIWLGLRMCFNLFSAENKKRRRVEEHIVR